jgi:anti-sigma B factor antagonist
MSNVEITSQTDGNVVSLFLSGQALDASNVQQFRTQTAPLFESEKKFVIVFRDLKFVDSSGIGALLSCLRKSNEGGGDVKLAELTPNVRSLFELVRMDRLFEIFDTREDAIASFKA